MAIGFSFGDDDRVPDDDDGSIFFRHWKDDKNPIMHQSSNCTQECMKACITELESFVGPAEEYSPTVAAMLRERIKQLKKKL